MTVPQTLEIVVTHRIEFASDTRNALFDLADAFSASVAAACASALAAMPNPVRETPQGAPPSHVAPCASAPVTGQELPASGISPPVQRSRVGSSAPAPESTHLLSKPSPWTPERDAVLREGVPGGWTTADILSAINLLPGLPIASTAHVAGRASALDLRRPAGWDANRQRVIVAAPARGQPTTAAAAPVLYSEERNAIISRDWALGIHAAVIMQRCNELPGKPLTDVTRIAIQASKLGIKRPLGHNYSGERRQRAEAPVADAAPKPVAAGKPLVPFTRTAPIAAAPETATPPATPPAASPAPAKPIPFAHQTKAAAPAPRVVTPPPKAKPEVDLPLRTPEREKRMRDGIARNETFGQLVSAVNCFPGARVTAAELQAWISELKPESAGPRAAGVLRTDARRRLLEAAFKTGDCPEHIATKLNALEGPKFDAKSVQNWIADLKLTRMVETPTAGLRMIDYNAAVTWAIREGVTFRSCDDKDVHRAINQAREEAGLPLWKIVEPRGKKMAIPHKALAA